MMTQPSGPKAVAMVSLGKYCLTAQAMISCGDAPSKRLLCSANSSSSSGVAVTIGEGTFSGTIAGCIGPMLVVAVRSFNDILIWQENGIGLNDTYVSNLSQL